MSMKFTVICGLLILGSFMAVYKEGKEAIQATREADTALLKVYLRD